MKMESSKSFMLFGATICPADSTVNNDNNMVENAPPALVNQEQEPSSNRAVIPIQHEPEVPQGPCFIVKKRLEASDVNPAQSRFLIPTCRTILQVLTDYERDMILHENKSLKVQVMDSRQCYFDMDFKWWPCLKKLVLNKGWTKLVKANQLKKGDVVEIWSYRQDHLLCFAVYIIERSTIVSSNTSH